MPSRAKKTDDAFVLLFCHTCTYHREHSGGRRSYDVDAMAAGQTDPAEPTQTIGYMYMFP